MVGQMVMNRYEVQRPIGRGGSGIVYHGEDQRLRRSVAIKVIHSEEPARVLREARAVARLSHPGIVTLYEFGDHEDQAVLVSELVIGATLRELAHSGELDQRRLAWMGAEMCSALEHAHSRGVVHRDIKPENLIAREGAITGGERGPGQVKLTDFGIAHVDDSPRLTRTGLMSGTLAYMPPETINGEDAGPAGDTYALALTLRELWCGRNPLERGGYAATVAAIQQGPPPMEDERPDLPLELSRTIDLCLDSDPESRPTVSDLGAVLVEIAPHLPDSAVPRPADAAPEPDPEPGLDRRPALLGAVALGGLIALVGAPGLAVLIALLASTLALTGGRTRGSAAALGAAPLAAMSAGILVPALVAASTRRVLPAVVAAWVWALSLGELIGFGSLSESSSVSAGWTGSASLALERFLVPLADPSALAMLGIWALGAAGLRALTLMREPGFAALGVLPWAAGIASAMALVPALGSPHPVSSVCALAAGLMVVALRPAETSRQQQPREVPRAAIGRPVAGHSPAPFQP